MFKKENNSKTEFFKISEINIPECMFHPYTIEDKNLNFLYSSIGGIVPSQLIMMTGVPGSGKTTLAAYTGTLINQFLEKNEPYEGRKHGPVFFISKEMSDFQIKMLSKRVGNLDDIILVKGKKTSELKDWLIDMYNYEPSLIILDSIQKLSEEMEGSFTNNQKKILTILSEYTKKTMTPAILIGHVTKNGGYAGPSTLQHGIDSHIHIIIDKDTQERKITTLKNRFGPLNEITMRFSEQNIEFDGPFSLIDDNLCVDIIREFHNRNKEIVTPKITEFFFKDVFVKLKETYKSEIEKANKSISNINLVFDRGKSIKGVPKINTLYFGISVIKQENISYFNDTEFNYMKDICETNRDELIWVFLREFIKIICPNLSDMEISQKTYKVATENHYFFSRCL